MMNRRKMLLAIGLSCLLPSIIVGKELHVNDGGDRVRPRLTADQRRQVNSMIRRTVACVYDYGDPVVVDGMIGRLSIA